MTLALHEIVLLIVAFICLSLSCYSKGRIDGFDKGIKKGLEIGRDGREHGA